METSLMSESVVNAGDVEESVTQVLTHFVQGGGEQAAMSVQLLAEQVEIDLGYEKGSLSKWHNFLGRTLRDFFKSKNPASVHTALTWAAKGPEPAAVPRHRPRKGWVWNATAKPILNEAGSVTGFNGAWVNANAAHDPGVQPAVRPNHRPPKGKKWNGTATAITNENGVLIGYTGAWENADAEDASSDISGDDLDDMSLGLGNTKRCRRGGKYYRAFNSEWKDILPWLLLVSTLTGEDICPVRGKECLGCAACAVMLCSVCMERNTKPAPGSNIGYNPFVTRGSTNFRKDNIQEHTNSYHKADLDQTQNSVTDCVSVLNASYRDKIVAVLRNVYWMVKENISMRKIEGLCALLRGLPPYGNKRVEPRCITV